MYWSVVIYWYTDVDYVEFQNIRGGHYNNSSYNVSLRKNSAKVISSIFQIFKVNAIVFACEINGKNASFVKMIAENDWHFISLYLIANCSCINLK